MNMLALLPFSILILSTPILAEECCKYRGHFFDRNFQMGMTDDYFSSMMRHYLRDFRPWHYLSAPKNLGSTVNTNNDKYEFLLDVQQFMPSEISVKIDDKYVVVEAIHEEKKDEHGFVSRQLVRRYSIPDGVEAEEVIAQLSTDGILSVSAPKNAKAHAERAVPIALTEPKRNENKETTETCDSGTCNAI